jgi:hypothetical protein
MGFTLRAGLTVNADQRAVMTTAVTKFAASLQ